MSYNLATPEQLGQIYDLGDALILKKLREIPRWYHHFVVTPGIYSFLKQISNNGVFIGVCEPKDQKSHETILRAELASNLYGFTVLMHMQSLLYSTPANQTGTLVALATVFGYRSKKVCLRSSNEDELCLPEINFQVAQDRYNTIIAPKYVSSKFKEPFSA